jgi:transcriptional regulator with XRE-family HTH domain
MKDRYVLKILLGQRIKQLREERHITQEDLADLMKVESDRQVRKWESGERFPSPTHLVALTKVFKIRVRDLFDFPDSDL